MTLTPQFRRLSIFQSPVDYREHKDPYVRTLFKFFDFRVGPLLYRVQFNLRRDKIVYFLFEIKNIFLEGQDLIDFFEKMNGDEFSLKQAEYLKKKIIQDEGVGLLNLKAGLEIRVFSAVVKIVTDFVKSYHPDELRFLAEPGRLSLYKRIIKRLIFPHSDLEWVGTHDGFEEYKIVFNHEWD